MSHYVRARHYSYVTGAWSTVDPLWPDESGYGYVEGRCAQWIDLTGNQKQTPPPGGLVLPKPIIVQPPPQIDPEITPGIRPKPGFGGGRGSACAVAAEVGWTLGRILDENLGISDAILEFLFNNPEEVLPECPKPPRTKSSILNTHRQLYFQGCKRYQGTIEPSFRCPMGTHYNIFYRCKDKKTGREALWSASIHCCLCADKRGVHYTCKDNIHGTSSIPKDAREF